MEQKLTQGSNRVRGDGEKGRGDSAVPGAGGVWSCLGIEAAAAALGTPSPVPGLSQREPCPWDIGQGQERLGSRGWGSSCPGGSAGTHDPRASMKMKVLRMLLVCFFQELLSSSSLRPISSRVEAGKAVRGRRRGD